MTDIKVGQVWATGDELLMVSSLISKEEVFAGKAERRGLAYAIVASPTPINKDELRRGTFVFDTEARGY